MESDFHSASVLVAFVIYMAIVYRILQREEA